MFAVLQGTENFMKVRAVSNLKCNTLTEGNVRK